MPTPSAATTVAVTDACAATAANPAAANAADAAASAFAAFLSLAAAVFFFLYFFHGRTFFVTMKFTLAVVVAVDPAATNLFADHAP